MFQKQFIQNHRDVVKTYAKGQNIEVVEIPHKDGVTDLDALEELIDEDIAAVIVQYPNFFGQIEHLTKSNKLTHAAKSIVCCF